MEHDVRIVALDIETTGLDPSACRVVGIGLAAAEGSEARISSDEAELLRWLENETRGLPDGTLLVTWNGEEFDLPFLCERFRAHGIATGLTLRLRGEVGKYGKPLHRARWGRISHVDIAPLYRSLAEERAISWRLKPVARSVLGIEPVEVDNRGEAIAALDEEVLKAYLCSDIEITLALAQRVVVSSDVAAELAS